MNVNVNTSTEEVPDNMYWDDLIDLKNETVRLLLAQQQLLIQLAEYHKAEVSINVPLNEAVNGLMKSYQDVGVEIRKTMDRHLTFDNGNITIIRSGLVSKDNDEYLEYISIAGEYIGAQELIGNLSTTAYLDIFAQLKVSELDLTKLRETYENGMTLIKNAMEENSDGKSE